MLQRANIVKKGGALFLERYIEELEDLDIVWCILEYCAGRWV
jgi:hypothetical protein